MCIYICDINIYITNKEYVFSRYGMILLVFEHVLISYCFYWKNMDDVIRSQEGQGPTAI